MVGTPASFAPNHMGGPRQNNLKISELGLEIEVYTDRWK